MKPWRIIKIVLSSLWLAVTLAGLIYLTVCVGSCNPSLFAHNNIMA